MNSHVIDPRRTVRNVARAAALLGVVATFSAQIGFAGDCDLESVQFSPEPKIDVCKNNPEKFSEVGTLDGVKLTCGGASTNC